MTWLEETQKQMEVAKNDLDAAKKAGLSEQVIKQLEHNYEVKKEKHDAQLTEKQKRKAELNERYAEQEKAFKGLKPLVDAYVAQVEETYTSKVEVNVRAQDAVSHVGEVRRLGAVEEYGILYLGGVADDASVAAHEVAAYVSALADGAFPAYQGGAGYRGARLDDAALAYRDALPVDYPGVSHHGAINHEGFGGTLP